MRGPAQPGHQSLCPTVTKSGNVLRLEVDSQSSQTVGPMPVISAYTLVPLHLGGLPGECGLSLVGRATPQGLGTGVTLLSSYSPVVGGPARSWPLLQPISLLLPLHPQNPRTHSLGAPPRRTLGPQSTLAA